MDSQRELCVICEESKSLCEYLLEPLLPEHVLLGQGKQTLYSCHSDQVHGVLNIKFKDWHYL